MASGTMNDGHTHSDDDGFEAALRSVIERAAENGIDVEGAWKVSSGREEGRDNWDVLITAVEYDDADGE